MRLTVLGQMIKGAWADAVTVETKAADLERIKWLLWHGNAPDAIGEIECLADDVAGALEENPTSVSLRKLATTLGEFATYITNNIGHIVNYGERFRAGERISTGFVESAVNQIVDKRFDKRQSMRWTPRGAHLLLQTRHVSSTATSINSSVAATQRSGNRQATTLPPVCDGLPYADIGGTLAGFGFERVQGSLYTTPSEDLANLFGAIMALKALPWLPASVRDIRAFRVEQWSDFTKLVKS